MDEETDEPMTMTLDELTRAYTDLIARAADLGRGL
jgi:hypothetical protein